MSAVSLLPRLSALGVSLSLERIRSSELSGPITGVSEEVAPFVSYAPSGGTRHSAAATSVATELREIAKKCGYPETRSLVGQAKFDRDSAIHLGQHMLLDSGEALRDDIWAYLTIVAAPDVVVWRFPDAAAHRFEGGVRNAFQRLWVRGTTLDRGEDHPERWGLVGALTEDAMVQIFERPAIGSRKRLARAIAEGWVEFATIYGRTVMQEIMRGAIKILRLRSQVIELSVLDDEQLAGVVTQCFSEGARMAGSVT